MEPDLMEIYATILHIMDIEVCREIIGNSPEAEALRHIVGKARQEQRILQRYYQLNAHRSKS